MKIVLLDGYTINPGDIGWGPLEALGDIEIYDRCEQDQIVERAKDAEIVLVNKLTFDDAVMASLPKLKYIGVTATGYNIVDVESARKRGITVTNIPAYGTDAVAQHTMALMLEIACRVGQHAQLVKEGAWAAQPDFSFWEHPLIELSGKTLGLIGTGRIGMTVAKMAAAFGMQVIAYNRTHYPEHEHAQFKYTSLETVLTTSDVISLHCPLTPETEQIINAEHLAMMKESAIFINTARGGLMDETALYEALKQKTIFAAGLDVLTLEPPEADHPLYHLDNCFITPHIAWAPKEARLRLMTIAADNIRAFMKGERLNIVS
ncbi:D-2-hydroxyacid dehydrogenase [Fusibacter paucivorans]|uniref:D-2-hydroxyacid dehydrogenase n=1 Tax=Fusibacter paucivorans TaxID=76009 RepID=A0ABS5PLS5_9FIRM|nr:D-2-hydroxyacid dehydrogenase [Fusibacter paucivorans]MBS7526119.1 D-2-hydroxyacid dehydrogenase [Fusibacter paucivorans]